MKSVHEGQTFSCIQCDYTTNRKYLLRKHTKSAHNLEEYFENDIKIKTEFKDENYHGADTQSIMQEEGHDKTVKLRSNIYVKSENGLIIDGASLKEEYFEDDTKPDVASMENVLNQ